MQGKFYINMKFIAMNQILKNENLSVELPIFIIHGNHEEPSEIENISSIDIFANKELNIILVK